MTKLTNLDLGIFNNITIPEIEPLLNLTELKELSPPTMSNLSDKLRILSILPKLENFILYGEQIKDDNLSVLSEFEIFSFISS